MIAQRYSSAFAFGLIEAGFVPGDKLVLYCDQTNSAESLVTQLGSIKAGVSVVTFEEKDNIEAFDQTLSASAAKGLILSPSTAAQAGATRLTFLQKLMPELSKMYAGDEVSVAKYPNLKLVAQTGHTAVRGVNMYRDLTVYANPALSTRQIPENQAAWVTHIAYKGGKQTLSLTSADLVTKSKSLWESSLSKSGDESTPIFMACDLESPLGFASFLACSAHFKKVFVPGTFNVSQMLHSVPRQGSTLVVCDADLAALEMPPAKKSEYQTMCSKVTNVFALGQTVSKSELFPSAKVESKDKYQF